MVHTSLLVKELHFFAQHSFLCSAWLTTSRAHCSRQR